MAQVYFDRVQETGSAGLADFTLGGAVSGYQAFGTVCGNGDEVSYCAILATQWEVGLGTYNAGTLERTTVQDSSTGGAKVNFAGVPAVFLTWSGVDAAAAGGGGGTGTVTSVSVAAANGFTGTVANATTTPAITIIAGAISPTSVTSTFSGNLTGNVTGNASGSSGSTTGNAATATALQTSRNINGVAFNGTANIDITPDVAHGGTGGTTAATANVALTPATTAIAALDIDWALGNTFSKTIAGNSTFTFSNLQDGRVIVVSVIASGSFTATWPTVLWPGGTPPVQTASGRDVYTFVRIGSDTIGSAVQAVA